jgi:DNA-binding LacI/PurR family transcriptional regulator
MIYEEIYSDLLQQLESGTWKPGDKLPTERELAERYGVSRPTISRVMNRLRDSGQLRRVVGAGTFLVEQGLQSSALHKTFGLFVPGLGQGEIFEPICARIAELSHEYDFNLIWGSIPQDQGLYLEERLNQTVQRFIEHGVDGVFFQPIERESRLKNRNQQFVSQFKAAGIPLVLLDSDFVPYPERSPHDLVGIDNIQAGFVLCDHFLSRERQRVDFLWQPNTAETYSLRLIGYREALYRAGICPDRGYEHEGDPRDPDFVRGLVEGGARNIICVNDETAVLLMRGLEGIGLKVPEDARLAGFDDLKYARLAHVPLTTMRQPCREIGELALSAMISRVENPSLPPRSIAAVATLCARESTSTTTQEG